ncbi:MAG: RNA polymerase sigma factor [Actinomycetota bacterium]|nr:RNA polymerase sigma factor [Actinomycetota bacterium]
METTELRKIVRKAIAGDEEAAGALFDHYHPRVFAYALSKLRNRSDAEDVASEAFARVLRDIDKFRWKGSGFEAWLFRIAANLIVDHVRRNRRETPSDSASNETASTQELDPLASVLAGEQAARLGSMLESLADEQREVVLLRFAAGLDTSEVGHVMGRKPNAVRQLQFRALTNLRGMMREEVEAR